MKILLIRLRLIGDVVFTTPALAALKRRFPDASVTYLVEPAAEPVLRHNPHISSLVVVDRPRGWRRVPYDLRLALTLRGQGFDTVIDFHGGPRSAFLTWATGARTRIGYAIPGRTYAYTELLPWSRALVPPRHSVRNQWDLLTPLGVAPPDAGEPPVAMPEDEAAARRVRDRMAAAQVPDDARVIVMHVSAGNPFRRWPPEHFADVAAGLAREDPARRIIISSGPSDRDAAEATAAAAAARAGAAAGQIVRCGDFDLSELRALTARAALYIGGDSGPLHVAATTAVPIVALFGPTLPERSMPWRQPSRAIAVDGGPLPCRPCHQRHCVPGDFRCLTALEPDRVLAAARELLSRENEPRGVRSR